MSSLDASFDMPLHEAQSNLSATRNSFNRQGKMLELQEADIDSLFDFMRPFVESGRLLPRTKEDIKQNLDGYIVYKIDGKIRASASLITYPFTGPGGTPQAEIAAVAVEETYSHLGIGELLIETLAIRARLCDAKSVFILTTQSGEWFKRLGFKHDELDSLPPKRRAKWTAKRGSEVFRLAL